MHAITPIEKKIEKFYRSEDWNKAKIVTLQNLKKNPKNHFLWTRLASIYFEQKNKEKSLSAAKKAYVLSPNCPLVCWDYGNALVGTGHHNRAVIVFKRLLRMNVKGVARGKCGQGLKNAQKLVNDTKYVLGICLYEMGLKQESLKFINDHIRNRKKGVKSNYPLSVVKTWLYWPTRKPNDVRIPDSLPSS